MNESAAVFDKLFHNGQLGEQQAKLYTDRESLLRDETGSGEKDAVLLGQNETIHRKVQIAESLRLDENPGYIAGVLGWNLHRYNCVFVDGDHEAVAREANDERTRRVANRIKLLDKGLQIFSQWEEKNSGQKNRRLIKEDADTLRVLRMLFHIPKHECSQFGDMRSVLNMNRESFNRHRQRAQRRLPEAMGYEFPQGHALHVIRQILGSRIKHSVVCLLEEEHLELLRENIDRLRLLRPDLADNIEMLCLQIGLDGSVPLSKRKMCGIMNIKDKRDCDRMRHKALDALWYVYLRQENHLYPELRFHGSLVRLAIATPISEIRKMLVEVLDGDSIKDMALVWRLIWNGAIPKEFEEMLSYRSRDVPHDEKKRRRYREAYARCGIRTVRKFQSDLVKAKEMDEQDKRERAIHC